MEARERMKVNIRNVILENADGIIVKSYAHKLLTLITNEHTLKQEDENSDEKIWDARVLYRFEVRLTISDSKSESIIKFWSLHIKLFMFFVSTGSKMKILPLSRINEGIVILDFLNPGDAHRFYLYALRNHRQRKVIQ